jgi:hypothetical protein
MGIADRMRTLLHGDGMRTAHAATPAEILRSIGPVPSVCQQLETLAGLGISLREPLSVSAVDEAIDRAARRALEADPTAEEQPGATPPVPGLQRAAYWWLLHERIDGRYAVQGRHRILPPRADLFGEHAPDAEQLARSIRKVAQRLCSDTGAAVPEVEVTDLQVRSQLLTTATVRLNGVAHAWSDVRDRDFVRTLARVCSSSQQKVMVFDDHGADTHWTRPMVDVLVAPSAHVQEIAELLADHVRPAVAAAHAWIDLPYSGRDEAPRGRILELRTPDGRRSARRTPWAPAALAHRAA